MQRSAVAASAVVVVAAVATAAAQSPSAPAAEPSPRAPGTITEYIIEYPGHEQPTGQPHHGSTHEITFDESGGDTLWVTGQNDDALVEVTIDGQMTFHEMPQGSGPHGIHFDAQSRLLVTLEFLGEIAQVDPDGEIVARHDVKIDCDTCAEPLNSHPHGLGIDADGETVWYTGKSTDTIGRVNPDGSVDTFALGTVGSVPIYIRAGPDGNMWFTELVGNAIGRITPEGIVTEFPIPTANSRPIAIVPGPDGNMWFTEEAGDRVARIAMDGTITEFAVPKTQNNVILAGLAFDSESHLWVQQYVNEGTPGASGNDFVIRIDKSILDADPSDISRVPFTFYAIPTNATIMHRIIEGPDGDMWFTELGPDRLGRVETP